jgi:hypothetical protein
MMQLRPQRLHGCLAHHANPVLSCARVGQGPPPLSLTARAMELNGKENFDPRTGMHAIGALAKRKRERERAPLQASARVRMDLDPMSYDARALGT